MGTKVILGVTGGEIGVIVGGMIWVGCDVFPQESVSESTMIPVKIEFFDCRHFDTPIHFEKGLFWRISIYGPNRAKKMDRSIDSNCSATARACSLAMPITPTE